MTEEEYLRKRVAYSMSDAPKEVIKEALDDLEARWKAQQAAMAVNGDLDDLN